MPPTSSELINAVSHPLRRRILFAFVDGWAECASARELAGMLDQQVGQVAYHLKTLARGGILLPVQSGSGQGAEQAHYGWTLGVEAGWLGLLLEVWTDLDVSR